ncbi:hypothetical protein QTO34_012723, partial [Cnephaeus nilssonii]
MGSQGTPALAKASRSKPVLSDELLLAPIRTGHGREDILVFVLTERRNLPQKERGQADAQKQQSGRERDRELETSMREKHQSAASCTPPTGDVPTTKVHALDRESNLGPFSPQADALSTEPNRGLHLSEPEPMASPFSFHLPSSPPSQLFVSQAGICFTSSK